MTSAAIFESMFSALPVLSGFSPGRVNLIGEHIDYNGGWVLPTALKLGLSISASPRMDDKIRITSNGFKDIPVRHISDQAEGHWSDYALGAVKFAQTYGLLSGGADIAINSNLPRGAGLSSSAAIIVGLLKLFRDISGAGINDIKIAQIARTVENDFIGVPCGIMDQMAVALALPGQAMQLDTDSLEYDIIPIPEGYHMVVIHSGQYRQLNEGRYKERKEECDIIKDYLGRDDICLMSDEEFARLDVLPKTIQLRAKHCVSEHRRTVKAAQNLKQQTMVEFGKLMTESHASMRDDFEISLPAIDALVSDANKFGALGARMTGGGFGGCIVACVEQNKLEDWKEKLLDHHSEAFYVC